METEDDGKGSVEEVLSPKLHLLVFRQQAQMESCVELQLGSMWEGNGVLCSKAFSAGVHMQKPLEEVLIDGGT